MTEIRDGTNIAALNQKVIGLEGDVQALRHDMSAGIANLRHDVTAQFTQINTKLDSRGDIKWLAAPAIALAMLILAIVGGLGTLSLNPVKEDSIRVRHELEMTRRDAVETNRRQWDYISKMRSDFDFLRGQLTPLRPQ
jgi:hypothetical protein